MDNSVIIKGSNSGITVFLDSEMAFEDLLESVSEKFKSASKFFNNANMAISFDGRDLSAEEEKRILNVISDVSELNIVCVLDENNNMKEISSVRPHAGKALCDHHGSRGTREAGQKCAAFEIVLHVLGIMEVRGRNIVCIHMSHFHQGPEFPQTFISHCLPP